jgi:hypothetical protein
MNDPPSPLTPTLKLTTFLPTPIFPFFFCFFLSPQSAVASEEQAALGALLGEVLGESARLEAAGIPAADRARALYLRGRLQVSVGTFHKRHFAVEMLAVRLVFSTACV